MKKFLIILIAASTILSSCKKDKAVESPLKDYSLVIKDKVWWGQFTNTGELPQNYSVQFREGNILLWSQLSGDYPGTWAVDKNKLTLNFTNPVVNVTADITDDNKLTNIITSTANKVNSGELVPNPNMVLENIDWKGFYTIYTFQANFWSGSLLLLKINNTTNGPFAYNRGGSGDYIRFKNSGNKDVFGVITSAGEIKGCDFNSYGFWNLHK